MTDPVVVEFERQSLALADAVEAWDKAHHDLMVVVFTMAAAFGRQVAEGELAKIRSEMKGASR